MQNPLEIIFTASSCSYECMCWRLQRAKLQLQGMQRQSVALSSTCCSSFDEVTLQGSSATAYHEVIFKCFYGSVCTFECMWVGNCSFGACSGSQSYVLFTLHAVTLRGSGTAASWSPIRGRCHTQSDLATRSGLGSLKFSGYKGIPVERSYRGTLVRQKHLWATTTYRSSYRLSRCTGHRGLTVVAVVCVGQQAPSFRSAPAPRS